MAAFLTILIVAVVLAAIVVVLFAYFYHRASREVSLIRTGAGGRQVVMDGGVIAIPYFHDVTRVNMQTLRLEVRRAGEQSLITKDRLRVDAAVEFYVSVVSDPEAIALASQTLGDRTFKADRLRDLIEGKLVDTLRSVAARMTMDELHENRAEFVREVREILKEPLSRNGLALESVSLTALDQTPFGTLDENNAFNAVGMRKLTEVISTSKKERAAIESEAEVAVHRSSMEASKRKLEIDLEQQEAQIHQTLELERLRAEQLAQIATNKAAGERSATEARIDMERQIRTAELAREKAVREAEIAQAQALEIAEQERTIAVAKKTEAESKAVAAADLARAEAVSAAEAIASSRAVAEAERRKKIALLSAEQENEVSVSRLMARAKAEAEAAVEKSKQTLEEAKAEAEAASLRIATLKNEMSARAAGQKALNEAENVFNAEIIELKRDIARLEALPKLVEQMVKPAEKIDSIRIHQIGGGLAPIGGGASGSGGKPPVNQALDSIMEMAVQLPALKKIGKELGLSIEDGLSGLADAATDSEKKK